VTLLIVNADDYGLTEATSRTILECHTDGVLTSTTVLVPAPGFAATVGWLRDHPDLGVGVHLALVGEDPPVLPAAEIPTLVDDRGRFPISWRQFARSASLGRLDRADVERELRAQIESVQQAGVTLTHLDSHQHLHEWPTLWPVLVRLAEFADVRAIRTTRAPGVGPMAVLGRLAALRAGRAGLATTTRFAGFSDSGSLTEPALLAAIDSIPAGVHSVEIGCHPGADEDADRSRYEWDFHWAQEAAGLRSPAVRERIERGGFRLGTFGDL